MKLGDLSCK